MRLILEVWRFCVKGLSLIMSIYMYFINRGVRIIGVSKVIIYINVLWQYIMTWHWPIHCWWKLSSDDTVSVDMNIQNILFPRCTLLSSWNWSEQLKTQLGNHICTFCKHQTPFQKTGAFTLESQNHWNVISYTSRQWQTLSVSNRSHPPGPPGVWRVNGRNLETNWVSDKHHSRTNNASMETYMHHGLFTTPIRVDLLGSRNVVQIPQSTSPMSHNAVFCNKNVHMCAYLLWNTTSGNVCLTHCGICEIGL